MRSAFFAQLEVAIASLGYCSLNPNRLTIVKPMLQGCGSLKHPLTRKLPCYEPLLKLSFSHIPFELGYLGPAQHSIPKMNLMDLSFLRVVIQQDRKFVSMEQRDIREQPFGTCRFEHADGMVKRILRQWVD